MCKIKVLLKKVPKRTVILLLLFIILVSLLGFQQMNTTIEYPSIPINIKSEFLSEAYFIELTKEYERIRIDYQKWHRVDHSKDIASHAILNQMMSDLLNNQMLLNGHMHFDLFFETFNHHVNQLPVLTEEIHYFRNVLNTYSAAPEKLEDMIELAACGKWNLFSGTYHRNEADDYDAAYNVKFVSQNGRFEVVYNIETGQLIEDAINFGTYNFAPGSIVPWKYMKHFKYDKTPWKKWGTTKEVSYNDIKKLQSKHGTTEQKQSTKELKLLIKNKATEINSCN